jgi:hypothetical protein
MARYFFDTSDGKKLMRDEVGIELDDLARVRAEAIDAVPDLARDKLPDGDERVFLVQARDHGGRVVFTATLSFKGEWGVPPP